MRQNFPKLPGSKYLYHLLSEKFIYQEPKWSKKHLDEIIKFEAIHSGTKQKLRKWARNFKFWLWDISSLQLSLFVSPNKKRVVVNTTTTNSKRNSVLDMRIPHFLKFYQIKIISASTFVYFLYNSFYIILY